MDHPRKFAADDEFCEDKPPVTFHLFMANKPKKRNLDRLQGKRISVVVDSSSVRKRRGTSATPSRRNGISTTLRNASFPSSARAI
jgi:hypothetical protein